MIQKYLGIGLILSLILFSIYAGGYHQGQIKATEKYLPQVTELNDKIKAADDKARDDLKTYQENANAIQQSNDARIASIRDYYKRLLSGQTHTGSASSGSQATDGASFQSTLTGCPASIEENCALDANKVRSWQEWAIKNKIPVSVD